MNIHSSSPVRFGRLYKPWEKACREIAKSVGESDWRNMASFTPDTYSPYTHLSPKDRVEWKQLAEEQNAPKDREHRQQLSQKFEDLGRWLNTTAQFAGVLKVWDELPFEVDTQWSFSIAQSFVRSLGGQMGGSTVTVTKPTRKEIDLHQED